MNQLQMLAWATEEMPWEEMTNPVTGKPFYRKFVMQDPDTGMEIMVVRYPAGTVSQWHHHPCGHGLFVLEGTLFTHEGLHHEGDFVWYPEGNIGEHGATPDAPVTLLFITNKPFDIEFTQGPTGP